VHDDLTLLTRAQSHDQDALAEIHDRYYDRIYRYLSFRVGDPETAEDLTSDVFIRFLTAIRERSRPPNSLRGWLYGTASNVLKEHYRAQKRQAAEELPETLAGTEPGPERWLESRQQRMRLQSAISTLTDDQQTVLALRFGYDMPIRDVAETVNKSEGSVKMLQARAIMALTNLLAAEGEAR
jgi:RNA polymerase sigma-70 factor (ECF subfamily)